jgi:hypothetical protein
MAIALTGLEAGTIAGVERGFVSIGDEHDRALDDIDKLVFVSVANGADWTRRPGPTPTAAAIEAADGDPGAAPRSITEVPV